MVQKDKKGRPFAFLNFEQSEHAKAAIDELHGKDFRTEEQKTAAAEEKGEKEGGRRTMFFQQWGNGTVVKVNSGTTRRTIGVDSRLQTEKRNQRTLSHIATTTCGS